MGIGEEIAKVAYELFEKRGRGHGCHDDDWLEAEKIVMARHAKKEEEGIKLSRSGKNRAAVKAPKEKKASPVKKAASKKRAPTKKTTI